MRRHGGEPVGQLGSVSVTDGDAARGREHAQHRGADVGERHVHPGQCERLGVGDQVREPQPQRGRVTEYPVNRRMQRVQVKQGLVHVEHDDRLLSHVAPSLSVISWMSIYVGSAAPGAPRRRQLGGGCLACARSPSMSASAGMSSWPAGARCGNSGTTG